MSTQNGAANTQVAETPKTKMELLKNFFTKETVISQLNSVVGESKDTFVASVIDLYSGDTYLQNCHPELVAMQALKAAMLKLPVIKSLGFAYIVPYKSDNKLLPQLQIGYKGLIQLAIRTNQYKHINAGVVYEGEFRKVNKLTGEIDLGGNKESDVVVGYFSHFEMKNGFSKTIFSTKEQIDAHAKKFSKSYHTAGSVWKSNFDAMALKTVIRNLFSHWGYMSVEMQDAISDDDVDVADKVMKDFAANGNAKSMEGFTDATVVDPIDNPAPENAPF